MYDGVGGDGVSCAPGIAIEMKAASSISYELKSRPLLEGSRDRPKADMNALVQTITAFSKMAVQLGWSRGFWV